MASITKKENGSFLIRVYNGIKDGKPQSVAVTFRANPGASPATARRAAEKYAILFEELVHSGGYEKKVSANFAPRIRQKLKLSEFVQKYYYPAILKHLSPNTCRIYEQIIDNLILPSFGMVELVDIDSSHLQSFVDFLLTAEARMTGDRGLSPASVKRYATVFASILTEAWKQKKIEVNPFEYAYIQYPKIVQPKLEVYSDDEIALFIAELEEENARTKAILLLAVTTGLRRAEIVGLMWSDIDFEKRSVAVSRSAYKPKGEEQRTKSPKSRCSYRTVFMPESCVRALQEWQIEQARQKRHSNGMWHDNDFVFTDKNGKNISVYAPTRICSDFERRHGLRHLKFHGLRHTCGSLMIEHGADPETVKAVLGHESIQTTNRYLHPYENRMRRASEKMENIIHGRADDETENDSNGGL